jgi:tetratricopeptide (TPR) repeat protein
MGKTFCFLLLCSLAACKSPEGPSTDPGQNRYFNNYNIIYKDWAIVPLDSTRQRLTIYLQEFPENAEAQMLMGNIWYAGGAYDTAAAFYRKAIALNPYHAVFHGALANVLMVQNQLDSADLQIVKALELKDSSAYTFLTAAMLNVKKQNKAKSLAFADSALTRAGSLPVIYSGLSYVYASLGEQEKSRQLFLRSASLGLKDTASFKEVLTGQRKPEDYYRIYY